jgi:hypothetical protein
MVSLKKLRMCSEDVVVLACYRSLRVCTSESCRSVVDSLVVFLLVVLHRQALRIGILFAVLFPGFLESISSDVNVL